MTSVLMAGVLSSQSCVSSRTAQWISARTYDAYVKTADVRSGDKVYQRDGKYYIELPVHRAEPGCRSAYGCWTSGATRIPQGETMTHMFVEIPDTFAQFLMGHPGDERPEWLNPTKESSKMTQVGSICHLPRISVVEEFHHTPMLLPTIVVTPFAFAYDVFATAVSLPVTILSTPVHLLALNTSFFAPHSGEEDDSVDSPDHNPFFTKLDFESFHKLTKKEGVELASNPDSNEVMQETQMERADGAVVAKRVLNTGVVRTKRKAPSKSSAQASSGVRREDVQLSL